MAAKPKPTASLSVGDDDENDAEIQASFLGVNRKIVKTAHEPKPPADYVGSTEDVVAAAEKQKVEQQKPKKKVIKDAAQISMADADKLVQNDDDNKEEPKADDSNTEDKNKKKADDK